MTTDFIEPRFGLDKAAPPRNAGLSHIGSFITGLLGRQRSVYAEGSRIRRSRRVLYRLSDRMLRDIGLSEAEIADLRASEPFPRFGSEHNPLRLLAR